MRKFWSTLALLTLTASLAACGGGDAAFQTPATGGTASSVAKLAVASSAATLAPDGTTATITVTATDANNVAVSGAAVTFATSTGTLAVTSPTTSATGLATATLSAQGLTAGTVITVTATSGSITGKTTVTVATSQQTLTLTTSVPQIPSAPGSSPATIKALVVDGSNKVIAGVPVNFQATSGALSITQGTTDATGTAIATLSAGTSSQNRSITVTATAGTSSSTIQVAVIGTTLTLSGPTSLVQGAQANFTATLSDSGGTGIIGQPITLTSIKGNTIAPASVTTGALGSATFVLTAANAGADTLTASGYGGALVSSPQALSVSNQSFTVTVTPTAPVTTSTIPVGIANAVPVTVTWTATGTGQTGTVNFATSRGTITPASVTVTGGTMAQSVTVYSSSAGPATISATAVQSGVTVATAQAQVSFVAPVSTAAAISIQANPSRVATQGQSTVVATVVDNSTPSPNPVLGATVNFTLTDATGGTLSAGSAITNAQGQATVTYTATSLSSAPNGVNIQAEVLGTSISSSTTLTVGGQTVFLSLGTGNTITAFSSTQYELPYTVQAADASGAGLSGVTVTFAVQSISYFMGKMVFASPTWGPVYSVSAPSSCPASQVWEQNGVIVSPAPSPTTGYVLTNIPGSVATTDISSAVTSAAGSAGVNLIYPKDHSYWVSVALTATATVSGTQNSTTATFILPGLAADYSNQAIAPPGPISPYGQATSCYPVTP
jgi:Bacterial Ig-like domain (group 1)